MKSILRQIADILYDVPLMDQDIMIGILNPLETEDKALEMLKYLKENKEDNEAMRVDTLLRKALQIGYNYYA